MNDRQQSDNGDGVRDNDDDDSVGERQFARLFSHANIKTDT